MRSILSLLFFLSTQTFAARVDTILVYSPSNTQTHRYGVNTYAHFTRPRLRLGEVHHLENFGTAELREANRLHRPVALPMVVSAANTPWGKSRWDS